MVDNDDWDYQGEVHQRGEYRHRPGGESYRVESASRGNHGGELDAVIRLSKG